MNQARVLNVCGLEYEVFFATAAEVPELATEEGICEAGRNRIYIRAGMPRTRTRDALVHEIVHAFFEGSGAGYLIEKSLKPSVNSEHFEDMLVRVVVPWLIRLVEDNGTLLLDVPEVAA